MAKNLKRMGNCALKCQQNLAFQYEPLATDKMSACT